MISTSTIMTTSTIIRLETKKKLRAFNIWHLASSSSPSSISWPSSGSRLRRSSGSDPGDGMPNAAARFSRWANQWTRLLQYRLERQKSLAFKIQKNHTASAMSWKNVPDSNLYQKYNSKTFLECKCHNGVCMSHKVKCSSDMGRYRLYIIERSETQCGQLKMRVNDRKMY